MSDESKDATPKAAETIPSETALNIRQAADFMGLSPQRLNRLRRRGEIPAKRAGWRDWSFQQADLMAYVERAAGVAGDAPPAAPAAAGQAPDKSVVLSDMAKLIAEMGPPLEEKQLPAEEAPIVRMANAILVMTLDAGASDLHIEPDRTNVRVRARIDGQMRLLMTMPKHIQWPIMNRFKVMAGITPFRSLVPQTGSIPIKHGHRDYNLRVSTIPGLYGESIVAHILDNSKILVGLSKIAFEASVQTTMEELSQSANGLLLFAGPPGSGLTTTAFTVLNKINSITQKICSFEEAPEYPLGGVEQIYRFGNRISVTDSVQALLRQNADVLFLGDIRDEETARCAVEAAQSGVLVMATISALDSVDALRRLASLGVSRADIAQAVIGVLAQRLVRRLCLDCREQYSVAGFELNRFGFRPTDLDAQVVLYRGAGCENCRNLGYRGRIALFEVLRINDEIAELFRRDASRTDLKDAALASGSIPMLEDGLAKFLQGLTTPNEVNQALGLLIRPPSRWR